MILFIAWLWLGIPCAFSGVDEGTVTWVDGKGAFEVRTERNGTTVIHASKELMGDELVRKQTLYPHLYKDIRAGDYIKLDWGRDPNAGKRIARYLGIKKRGG
jgi:hypothetical protein